MNEQTTQFLNALATKLGTTAEYLWSILVAQAPISATIQLIQTIILTVVTVFLWRAHKRFLNSKAYDAFEFYPGGAMTISAAIVLCIWIVNFFSIDNLISGFFNPEYWALNELLRAMK